MSKLVQHLRKEIGAVPRGFLMGAADVIPGVSGGTMALVLGIYGRFIGALRSIDLLPVRALWRWLAGGRKDEDWRTFTQSLVAIDLAFLVMLGAGIGTALVSMAHLIKWVLHTHPTPFRGMLFGLILGSSIIPLQEMKGPKATDYIPLPMGALLAFIVASPGAVATPDALWFTFVAGAVAICAMLLPGVSGSLLLVLLGKWATILEAIRSRQMVTLAVFAAGCATGLLGFSRFLHWLLRRYHDATMAFLTGLMLGALRAVWPWQVPVDHGLGANLLPADWGALTFLPMIWFVVGVAIIVVLRRLEKKLKPASTDDTAHPDTPPGGARPT